MPFSQEIIQVLMSSVNENDVEIKPDGTAPVKDGSLFRGGRAGANGGRPCSNSPDAPRFEVHFFADPPSLPRLCIKKHPNIHA